MKTMLAKSLIIAIMMLTGLMTTEKAVAQANPYPFTNNLSCTVKLKYQVLKAGNCLVCYSSPGAGILVNPGATMMFGLGGCPTGANCDLIFTIFEVDGVTLTSPIVAPLSSAGGSGTGAGSCGGTLTVNLTTTSGSVN